MYTNMVTVISIDGLIGCGKSTVIEQLSRNGYTAYPEPVSDWSLLEQFYQDQTRYAGALQMQILCSYHKLYKNIIADAVAVDPSSRAENKVVVVERSPWSSRYVFNEMQYERGNLTRAERDVYELYHDKLSFTPDGVVYMKVDTGIAYSRCVARSRPSEKKLNIEYLHALSDKYDKAVAALESTKRVTVVNVRAHDNQSTVYDAVVSAIENIRRARQ